MPNRSTSRSSLLFIAHCSLAAFGTYFCMYAFRKPFAVGTYEGYEIFGVDYKIVLIITQVMGYMLSKFAGIRIISEMAPQRRIAAILLCVGVAEVSLIFFGLIPAPYNFVCLFFNGLPLGLIWGLVYGFLEGRRLTELLGAGLCASFVLSSGVVKSVGQALIVHFGVSEFWMPAATGMVFSIPFLLSVWLLSTIPPPTREDEALRTRRIPMNRAQRWAFFRRYATGIVILVIVYMALTAYRDFRDNFAVELWAALGYRDAPAIFTLSELPIAGLTLIAAAAMVRIQDNRRAFWISQASVLAGAGLVGIATLGFQSKIVRPEAWFIAVGLGMYVPYIAYNVMVFERLIAATRHESNIGFLMYLADAFGYLGSVAVMLFRDFATPNLSWLDFFLQASYAMAVGCVVLISWSMLYFHRTLAETSESPDRRGRVATSNPLRI